MFEGVTNKLEDARRHLEDLRYARDTQAFKKEYSGFLSSFYAVTEALKRAGQTIPEFNTWWKQKLHEASSDELLNYVCQSRGDDIHQGKHRLLFPSVHLVSYGWTEPPFPGASFVFGTDGPFWIVDEGTPRERRIPAAGASFAVTVQLNNPPQFHLGKMLRENTPVTICELALTYLENLVYEARTKFAGLPTEL